MSLRIVFALITSCLLLNSCTETVASSPSIEAETEDSSVVIQHKETLIFPNEFIAEAFDFPVGKPNANSYYNAQKFQENSHLGDDWNAVTGGDTDLGDPIFAIGNGYVKDAIDYGWGWGNVVRILHQLPNGDQYESLYAHCDTMIVQKGDWINRGDQIGTIGNANGAYLAHLHLEIRIGPNMPLGGGYSEDTTGYVDPTKFINAHRTVK